MSDLTSDLALVCRVGARVYALPLARVVEIMRPMPIETMAGTSPFIRGLSIIRGVPTPIIDLGRLSGQEETRATRFVSITTGSRRIALLADSVVGIRPIPAESLQELPPLLGDLDAGVISAIGTLDAELLLVLRETNLVPEVLWSRIETGELIA